MTEAEKMNAKKPIVLLANIYSDQHITIHDVCSTAGIEVLPQHVVDIKNEGIQTISRGDFNIPWNLIESAIKSMVKKAKELAEQLSYSVHYYVAGCAPLPAFALLGYELTSHVKVTFINPPPNSSTFQKFALFGNSREALFNLDIPTRTNPTDGCIAIVITFTNRLQPANEQLLRFVKDIGCVLGDTAKLSRLQYLEESDSSNLAHHSHKILRHELPQIFPCASSFALFIEGPAPVAFALGQSVDKKLHRPVHIPYFNKDNGYQPAVTLQNTPVFPMFPKDSNAILQRKETLRSIASAVRTFQGQITNEIIALFLSENDAVKSMAHRIKGVEIDDKDEISNNFELHIEEGRVTFSRGLLHALATNIPDEKEKQRVGLLLFLHEIYYTTLTSNYHGIERTGYVFDEVDFWADTIALGIVTSLDAARGGMNAAENVRDIVSSWIESNLKGMEAIDRVTNAKGVLNPLYEHQLRRYLVWNLQLSRAQGLPKASNLQEAWKYIQDLFGERLIVEVAPLRTSLDMCSNKQLAPNPCREDTELRIAYKRKLFQLRTNSSFSVNELVNSIRTFNSGNISSMMKYVKSEISSFKLAIDLVAVTTVNTPN